MNPLFDAIPTPADWQVVTVRDQAEADRLIPELLAIAGVSRFVRVELGAGPIELSFGDSEGLPTNLEPFRERADLIGLVIVAGECGPDARPCHPVWLRSLRDQCEAAGVPFAFAGWGEFVPWCDLNDPDMATRVTARIPLMDLKFRSRMMPDGTFPAGTGAVVDRHEYMRLGAHMLPVGPELSGRSLDGRTHDGGAS